MKTIEFKLRDIKEMVQINRGFNNINFSLNVGDIIICDGENKFKLPIVTDLKSTTKDIENLSLLNIIRECLRGNYGYGITEDMGVWLVQTNAKHSQEFKDNVRKIGKLFETEFDDFIRLLLNSTFTEEGRSNINDVRPLVEKESDESKFYVLNLSDKVKYDFSKHDEFVKDIEEKHKASAYNINIFDIERIANILRETFNVDFGISKSKNSIEYSKKLLKQTVKDVLASDFRNREVILGPIAYYQGKRPVTVARIPKLLTEADLYNDKRDLDLTGSYESIPLKMTLNTHVLKPVFSVNEDIYVPSMEKNTNEVFLIDKGVLNNVEVELLFEYLGIEGEILDNLCKLSEVYNLLYNPSSSVLSSLLMCDFYNDNGGNIIDGDRPQVDYISFMSSKDDIVYRIQGYKIKEEDEDGESLTHIEKTITGDVLLRLNMGVLFKTDIDCYKLLNITNTRLSGVIEKFYELDDILKELLID